MCSSDLATVRTGVVLGREGGALAQMLPPFKMGVGGPIGNGRQYFPWIHLHDLVRVYVTALSDSRYDGPINGVAPGEATSTTFARALGRTLHRPAVLPVPALALRLLFGEAACVLLDSQRARPERLLALGFPFQFPDLPGALRDVLATPDVHIGPNGPSAHAASGRGQAGPNPGLSPSDTAYLEARPACYALRATTVIDAPIEDEIGRAHV